MTNAREICASPKVTWTLDGDSVETMKMSRLAKLAALTQGAALLGTLGAGCDKSAPPEAPRPPVINATATPMPVPSAPPAMDDAGGVDRLRPTMNAAPGRPWKMDDAGKSPTQQ